jgi:hypothetical protein
VVSPPNACNTFGESLLHSVCKFGQDKLLQVFLECGADIQISDYAGRTPMHEVCRQSCPSFKTFELLLQQDSRLIHMQDAAGAAPLSFVRADQYGAWIAFLESILDTYWKPRDASAGVQGPPPLALEKSNSRPVPDPQNALSLELAALVSGGRIAPDEAIAAYNPAEDDVDDTSWDEYDDDSDDYADSGIDFDETEFEELQQLVNFGRSYPTKGIRVEESNSLPMPDPENEWAALVSCGRKEPDEAIPTHNAADDDEDSNWEDYDYDDDDDSDDDIDFDEREFEELQQLVNFGWSHPIKGLRLEKSNSLSMPDPENELPALNSCGRIEPDEAIAAHNSAEDTWEDNDDDEDSDDDSDDDIDFDEKEFVEVQQLGNLGSSHLTKGRYFL